MIKYKFSIKQKSMFYMLLLISILLLTLYYQNRVENRNFLSQVESNYKKNFDNYLKLFEKQLIDYYESQTTYLSNNNSLIPLIIQKEPYLKDVEIVNLEEQKKSTSYIDMIKNQKSFLDIQVQDTEILYKLVVPTSQNSYFKYTLDSRIFLNSIKNFDGSDGVLLVKSENETKEVILKENKNNQFFQAVITKCEKSDSSPIIKYSSNFYVKKELELKDFTGKEVANAIFFLDITKDKYSSKNRLRESLLTSIILFLIAAVVVNYFFNYLIKNIEKNEDKLRRINKNLKSLVEKEIEERLKNNQLLIQQSKLAMLGEMIGNIAHQWRQPLMQLSAILMYLDAYNEKGKLTSEKLEKKVNDGNSIIDFMSKTIEDFRNYYKPEKQKEEFLIRESIDKALFIVQSSLKDANIKVSITCEPNDIKLLSYKNEFSQAILNIITNAKDALIQRKIDEPFIGIEVSKENKNINIHIQDNAGGISDEIIDKIFDPYFTTKHQSQGTGIGLYMTKMIIANNMNGTLKVENIDDGAIVKIALPFID